MELEYRDFLGENFCHYNQYGVTGAEPIKVHCWRMPALNFMATPLTIVHNWAR